ncbi:MAG TPA: cold shock domain-containing protein [Candidatus Dormibacteraeota bacterium]|nr:cold shock domain-containing protein [Candidatus Dormibacteraeota bacterium]
MELRGTIKAWKADRGFGFIKRDDGQPDTFVHICHFRMDDDLKSPEPRVGQRVIFDIGLDPKQPGKTARAKSVRFEGGDNGQSKSAA